jgi:hypothetical protein
MPAHAPRSRKVARFTKREVTRAIEGVRGAGLDIANIHVRVDPDGSIDIEIVLVIPGTTPPRARASKGGSVDNFRDIADVL